MFTSCYFTTCFLMAGFGHRDASAAIRSCRAASGWCVRTTHVSLLLNATWTWYVMHTHQKCLHTYAPFGTKAQAHAFALSCKHYCAAREHQLVSHPDPTQPSIVSWHQVATGTLQLYATNHARDIAHASITCTTHSTPTHMFSASQAGLNQVQRVPT